MQNSLTHYPVKLMSRTLPAARTNKLRVAWFVLGTAFGIGCSTALTPITLPSSPITADASAPLVVVETAETPITPVATEEVVAEAPVEAAVEAPAAEAAQPVALSNEATPEQEAPQLAAIDAPVAAAITYPHDETLKVENGDTFVSVLNRAGIGTQEAHTLVDAMKKSFNPKSLGVGDEIALTLDKKEGTDYTYISKLSLEISNTSSLNVSRDSKDNFVVKKIDVPVVKKMARAGGKIKTSLYDTIVESGMPITMVGEIIKAYSYDVDFQREIRAGDEIDVVFERMQTEDGKAVGFGNIIYASLDLGERDLRIYRYTDNVGNSEYYNMKGESVRKALLRTPINGARISSGFGMRNHPILGYSKMHKGVDFAAATGTPVYASGDGSVSFVGRKGGYGNYVQIKHNTQYASAYAHLSRFATGLAPGKKVKQGQIIAYVGSTGASTGPHLHYEIISNGTQVNPANIKFKTGNVLSGKELASFKKKVETIQAQLDSMPKGPGKVAMLEGSDKKSTN